MSMTTYKKLNNQPLTYVLAEFRFSPVMEIASYIPKIQEALRKSYPNSLKRGEQSFQIQASSVTVSTIDQWAFVSANKKSAVEISQERLIYATAEYPRFEGFSNICKAALSALVDIIGPSLIYRIGLRYGDVIKAAQGETISELVSNNFGMPNNCIDALGSNSQYISESLLETDIGKLVIRSLYGKNVATRLPDTHGLPIFIPSDNAPSERLILDFDHFWEAKDESVNFEVPEVLSKLSALHETARKAFWQVTSDYARKTKWA